MKTTELKDGYCYECEWCHQIFDYNDMDLDVDDAECPECHGPIVAEYDGNAE